MIFRELSRLAAVGSVAGCLLAGCASSPEAHGGRFMVSAPRSPFYKYGPAQAFGADFALNRGQRVTVVENSFGFSKVMTDDGISGFMPTDDLAPAPADAATAPPRMARTASRRGRAADGDDAPPRKSKVSTVEPGLPLFDPNDLPLPSNTPLAAPKPGKP